MTDGSRLGDEVAAAAEHGSFCPKMCSHACPVLRATGRADAVPWGFHRTVADLAAGRLRPSDAAPRLVACTGCGACAGPCEVDGQDVPAQVRAGRAALHAAGAADAAVGAAVAAVEGGRSPFGSAVPSIAGLGVEGTALSVGCRDDAATVAAAVRVLERLGRTVTVVAPDGCCGAVLRDLGATAEADAAASTTRARLEGAEQVVVLDPHCTQQLRDALPDVEVTDLVALLRDAADRFEGLGTGSVVRWHEPCLLRGREAAGAGPEALGATGALVGLAGEPHHGCSGGGMGLPLLDPSAADAVAADRLERLGGPGDAPVVTGCSGAAVRLAGAGAEAVHLAVLLSRMLEDDPEDVA